MTERKNIGKTLAVPFQDRCLQPLGHPSNLAELTYSAVIAFATNRELPAGCKPREQFHFEPEKTKRRQKEAPAGELGASWFQRGEGTFGGFGGKETRRMPKGYAMRSDVAQLQIRNL